MIKSKKEMHEWINAEQKDFVQKFPYSLVSEPCRFQRLLRKTEYYKNCRKDFAGRIIYTFYRICLEARGQKLGLSIPCNVCEKGLHIVHYGSVTINPKCVIGRNCRIYNNVVIGSLGSGYGNGRCPVIKDNVLIGSNAVIMGDITIGNNAVIAAGAVVTQNIPDNAVAAGVPAKIVKIKKSPERRI